MPTNITSLQWAPYQGGQRGTLITTVVLDSAVDTQFNVPTLGQWGTKTINADGVIFFNNQNNGAVFVTSGPAFNVVDQYNRDFLLLGESAPLNIGVQLTTGTLPLMFYKGVPPVNPSVPNYYGAVSNVIPNLGSITNSLTAMVPLLVAGTWYTGPEVIIQSMGGIWYASGTITLATAGVDVVEVRLWDGTTPMAETFFTTHTAFPNVYMTASISGIISNPNGKINISAAKTGATAISIEPTGASTTLASTVTAYRVG